MDEAERCHRLAYIAYGKLLATGTPDEVLHAASLATWDASEPAPTSPRWPTQLRGKPGVEQVTAFGNTLHVTGDGRGRARAGDRALRDDPTLSLAASRGRRSRTCSST